MKLKKNICILLTSVLLILFSLSSNISYANSSTAPIVNAPNEVNLSYVSSYEITISNVYTSRVRFPTWTIANGQDDLIWYEGVNAGSGIWKVTIPFSSHNNETGIYTTHIYKTNENKQEEMIMAADVNVIETPIINSPKQVGIAEESYDITVSHVHATDVRFPTWTILGDEPHNQDDLIWYPSENLGQGKWKVTIPLSNHNNDIGMYITHIYKFNEKNEPTTVGSAEVKVVDTHTLNAPEKSDIVYGSYDITISNVIAESVTFPTWTEQNGQDDLIWHQGVNLGKGMWKVTIPYTQHNNETGIYITHIYGYDKQGHPKFLLGTNVNVVSEIKPIKYEYDLNGRLVRVLLSDSRTMVIQYDSNGNMTNKTIRK